MSNESRPLITYHRSLIKIKAVKKNIIATIMLSAFIASSALAQSTKEKAEAIAAEFNKDKHKTKEKNGVIIEKNKVVEAKPDVRDDVTSYAGKYEMDGFGHFIVLHHTPGSWEGEYLTTKDGKEIKRATLKNITIESALLTATIHHEDGRAISFEGVFINRFENGEKSEGLGVRHLLELSNGFVADKAFYKRTE
jgi:hypothetical protein